MNLRQSLPILATILTCCAVACTPGMRVNAVTSKQADFTKYHVYAIRQGNSSGIPELDEQIQCQIETALFDKGWRQVQAGEPEAVVVQYTATRTMRTYEAFYRGSVWQWQSGGVRNEPFDIGTIVVDMFDAQSHEAIWHAFASRAIAVESPTARSMRVDEAVARMFEHFPSK